jgi:hypothetical protein
MNYIYLNPTSYSGQTVPSFLEIGLTVITDAQNVREMVGQFE